MDRLKATLSAAIGCWMALTPAAAQQGDSIQTAVAWTDSTRLGSGFKDRDEALMLYDYVFPDNWFYMLHVGSFVNWGTNQRHGSLPGRFRPAVGASVGKWFHPTVGARLQLYLGNNRGLTTASHKAYHWQTAGLAVDGLVNLSNLVAGYREGRRFGLLGYLGIGGDQTFGFSKRSWNDETTAGDGFKPQACSLLAFRAGLMAQWRLSEKWDLSLEATNVWVDDSYDGIEVSNRWDGHVNLLLGLVRRIGNRDNTHQFYYVRRDGSILAEANEEVNRLRAEAQRLRDLPPLPPVKAQQVYVIVSFRNELSDIDEMQQVNVYTAVQAMQQRNNGVNLYITPLGKAPSEALFRERAAAVSRLLTGRYGLPAQRIMTDSDSHRVEKNKDKDGCIILYINQSRSTNNTENEDRRLIDIP